MFIKRLRGCSRDALRIEALLTLRLVRLPWIETKQWRQWQHWCSWNKEIVQHFEVKQCQAMRFEQKPPYSCGSNTLHQRSKAWSLTNPGAMIHDLWVWIWDMFGLRRVDPFSTFQHHLGSWHFDLPASSWEGMTKPVPLRGIPRPLPDFVQTCSNNMSFVGWFRYY